MHLCADAASVSRRVAAAAKVEPVVEVIEKGAGAESEPPPRLGFIPAARSRRPSLAAVG